MRYLELDCTGSRSCPSFLDEVWPLLRNHASEVEEVFLLRTRGLQRHRLFRQRPEVQPSLFSLGPLSTLDEKTEGVVRVRSHYGGHVNVLYRTNSETLLRALVGLWPQAVTREKGEFGLGAEDQAAFDNAISWLTPSSAVVAFFHDGAPMLIFAPDDVLSSLREFHTNSVVPRHSG